MSDRSGLALQASENPGASAPIRVGTLVGSDGSLGTSDVLLAAPGLSLSETMSFSDVPRLARSGAVAAIIADPEQGGGWPIDTAEQIVSGARDLVPVILICRQAHDAALIEQRFGGPGVDVLLHGALTGQKLAEIVSGAAAAYAARARAGQRS